MPEIKCERDKYLWMYSYPKGSYGKTNHGRNAYLIVERLAPNSLLDVGCGKGGFVEWANRNGIMSVGMDFASGYGLTADILNIPFPDNSFDMVTAFDVLEHLRPEDLDRGLSEMNRVAKNTWLLSIGYGPSHKRMENGTVLKLHPISTRDHSWWTPYLEKYGDIRYEGSVYRKPTTPYIIVTLRKNGLQS